MKHIEQSLLPFFYYFQFKQIVAKIQHDPALKNNLFTILFTIYYYVS